MIKIKIFYRISKYCLEMFPTCDGGIHKVALTPRKIGSIQEHSFLLQYGNLQADTKIGG